MDKSLGAHGGFVATHSIISYSSCASSTYLPLTYQENCRAKLLATARQDLCRRRAAGTWLLRLPRRFYRIRHQHRNGHWTDAALAHVIGLQEFRAPNCCHNNVG